MIRRQKMIHYGYEFYLITYKNLELREIQIYMIHSEQAEVHQENYLIEDGADVPAMHIDPGNR